MFGPHDFAHRVPTEAERHEIAPLALVAAERRLKLVDVGATGAPGLRPRKPRAGGWC